MICVESIPTDGNLFGLRAGNGLCSRSSRETRFITATRVPLSVTIRGVTHASRTNRPVASWSCRIVIVLIMRLCHKRHILSTDCRGRRSPAQILPSAGRRVGALRRGAECPRRRRGPTWLPTPLHFRKSISRVRPRPGLRDNVAAPLPLDLIERLQLQDLRGESGLASVSLLSLERLPAHSRAALRRESAPRR